MICALLPLKRNKIQQIEISKILLKQKLDRIRGFKRRIARVFCREPAAAAAEATAAEATTITPATATAAAETAAAAAADFIRFEQLIMGHEFAVAVLAL
ncbi:hypothetical protein ETH_00024640 [Eimeria tenella]|uniref:Uncharacterized protein n=1 Tax=Eimeria tenella TaxID=5802 RepID=U6KW55_EIMTE|nr:hypothetical protein ETH_00024640 [Eimeria tenella]CDJ39740.1 hypothetical protein ETH_00024640 [Eimeria tenella]|eukprot:XP_013230493.1 hypothetical protein ETH_00024640 [Eimeria tenella]